MVKSHLLNPKKVFLLISFGLGTLLILLLHLKFEWKWYWAWWTGLSVITVAAYAIDKFQAQRQNAQRIPETVLHLLALAGGVAGAWVGRTLFRHKTLHRKFTFVLILASLIHIGLLIYLLF